MFWSRLTEEELGAGCLVFTKWKLKTNYSVLLEYQERGAPWGANLTCTQIKQLRWRSLAFSKINNVCQTEIILFEFHNHLFLAVFKVGRVDDPPAPVWGRFKCEGEGILTVNSCLGTGGEKGAGTLRRGRISTNHQERIIYYVQYRAARTEMTLYIYLKKDPVNNLNWYYVFIILVC